MTKREERQEGRGQVESEHGVTELDEVRRRGREGKHVERERNMEEKEACISHRDSSWTPGAFYTYFYNHARRLRLEKLL